MEERNWEFKRDSMQKISPPNYIARKIRRLSLIRVQDGFIPFTEKPSDKFEHFPEEVKADAGGRISALELFSLFTADIIKEKTLFVR